MLLRQSEAYGNRGIARGLTCFLAHRELPNHILPGAVSSGEIADSGFEPGGIAFATFQNDGIREQPPGAIADLVYPGRNLHTVRIGQEETPTIDAAHRLGEEYFHHGVLIDASCSWRWITGNAERSLVRGRAVDVDDPVAYRHGHWWRSLNHGRLGGRLATVAQAAKHARFKDKVVVSVGHIAEEVQRDNRFNRLVINSRRYGDWALSARRDYNRVAVDFLLVFRTAPGLAPRLSEE